jgi:hypothetical protein
MLPAIAGSRNKICKNETLHLLPGIALPLFSACRQHILGIKAKTSGVSNGAYSPGGLPVFSCLG